MHGQSTTWTAFEGDRRLASGSPDRVIRALRDAVGRDAGLVLVFDDATGRVVDVDLRSPDEQILRSAGVAPDPAQPAPRRPGRPRLGVVSREVTLLPRHWDWLGRQPGGASVALRRLVEAARRATAGTDRIRQAQDATYRFATAMAGDRPGYEEAMRALYASDQARFDELTAGWPADIREHARRSAEPAF